MNCIEKQLDLRRFKHSRRAAATVALSFVVAGALWVLVSDSVLYRLVKDPVLLARLETAKGWAFVAAAGLLVYFTAARSFALVQRSEAMLRAIIENLNDGVILVGPSGTIVGVNAAVTRMLGAPSQTMLLGLGADEFARLFRLCTPDGRLVPPDRYSSQRALRGEVVGTYAAVVHPLREPPLPITVTSAPVRAVADGPVEVSVTVVRDVQVLERLDCMRDEFFSAAAHALKTPVTTISLHAQLLAVRGDSARLRQVASTIHRQCCRIDWLVRNLLIASRIRHGRLKFHMESLDLARLALGTANEVHSREPGLPLALEIEAHPQVFADRERLELVLANLVTRAHLDAPSDEPVRLRVTVHDDRARVEIVASRVSNGATPSKDLPVELRARFDRTKDAGVELFVCEALVEAHGSRLLESVGSGEARLTWFDLPTIATTASTTYDA